MYYKCTYTHTCTYTYTYIHQYKHLYMYTHTVETTAFDSDGIVILLQMIRLGEDYWINVC